MDAVNSPSSFGIIRFLTGPLAGTTVPISKPIISIGREQNNDIIVSDPSVSRQHAQLVWNSGSWSVKKVAAQNSLTVNQREVQQSPLNDHDTIGLGTGTTFIIEGAPGIQPPSTMRSNQGPASFPQQTSNYPQQPNYPLQQPNYPQQANFPPQASYPQRAAKQPPQQEFLATVAASPPMMPTSPTGTEQSAFQIDGPSSVGGGVPTLEVSTNTHADKHTYQLTQPVIDIGRDPSNTVVINRPTVSAFHAQIVREGNQLVFVHPHPKRGRTLNGIDYQGRSYRGDEQFRHALKRGDVLRISDESGTFVTLTYNDGTGAPQDVLPEIRPIPLGAPVITIGRLPENTVVLNHPQVSSRHARLERVQDGYRIVDQGSTNHVYVNAQRTHAQMLKPGDEIRIGPFKLTYTGSQLTQHDESGGIRIDALHVTKRGNKNVILLNDLSIVIPPRKFVALVGGSGAGKSTFMDALNGLRPAQQGTILFNGQDYYKHLAAFSTQLGYVPQDDIIHRELTVERALYYAAKLRLPDDFTNEQIQQRINEVLEDVEMKRQRKLLVNRLSGGQRKRVSIALELLANPNVFFLDEPTSGLDPGLDRKMMMLMRKLADRGRTIILVTHATNNINACDYVCFLARGGHLAFFGPPNEAKEYFGKTDFAEIYSALEPTDENPNIPQEAGERFKQSPDYQSFVLQPISQGQASRSAMAQSEATAVKQPKRGNPWKQFRLLSLRYLELLKNDSVNLAILLLQAPVIALILLLMLKPDTFAPTSLASCPSRQDLTATSGKIVSFDCQRWIDAFNTPQGQAALAQNNKTMEQAKNDIIAPGSGGDAQKILFLMSFAAVLFGCINGSREIVKEAAIYTRERAVNLGIIPYMFSKFSVLGVLCLVQSLILTVVVMARSPIVTSIFLPSFVEIYITMALTSLAGLMIGLTISAIVPNNDRAMSLVPLALLPQVIFAGVIVSLDSTPFLQVIGAFFPTRWAMAALGSSVGLHGDKLNTDSFSYWGTLFSNFTQAQAIGHLLICWAALGIMIVLLAAFIGWCIKRKDVRV